MLWVLQQKSQNKTYNGAIHNSDILIIFFLFSRLYFLHEQERSRSNEYNFFREDFSSKSPASAITLFK